MLTSDNSKEPETNLLTALQTYFSRDADPEKFLARAKEQICEVEGVIIDTCSRNRIRIDDNLYALLESRDAIAEQRQEVDTATTSASEVTSNVNQAAEALTEKIQVSRNLDAALSVAAQTRKLTRMYARIEDTIDSRRLYTAFRMLKVLEEETRIAKPGTFLQELVPDTHRLRATITLHSRKYFHAWLDSIGKAEGELGAYAVRHAEKQASGREKLHARTTLASMSEQLSQQLHLSPKKSNTNPATKHIAEEKSKPWLPLLTSKTPLSAKLVPRSQTPLSYPSHLMGGIPSRKVTSGESGFRPEIGGDGRQTKWPFSADTREDAPMLYLRPLLQSALVNEGLDLFGEMRTEYRRERHAQLKKMLDELNTFGEDPKSPERDTTSIRTTKGWHVEQLALRMCGFFIVERSVNAHTIPTIMQQSTVDNEWWPSAHTKVMTVLKEQFDFASSNSTDAAFVRGLIGNLERFAYLYEFWA